MSRLPQFVQDGVATDVWTISGTVISNHIKSETHVTSSGGGGYVSDTGPSYIRAPSIHSYNSHEQEMWLLLANGEQKNIRLHETDLPAIAGQRVSFILAGRPDRDMGYYMRFVNHDARKWWSIQKGAWLVDKHNLMPVPSPGSHPMGCFGFSVLFLASPCLIGAISAGVGKLLMSMGAEARQKVADFGSQDFFKPLDDLMREVTNTPANSTQEIVLQNTAAILTTVLWTALMIYLILRAFAKSAEAKRQDVIRAEGQRKHDAYGKGLDIHLSQTARDLPFPN